MDVVFQGLIDTILLGLSKTYGLDWLTMFFGILGGYFMARKEARGILLNLIACTTSFSLALICDQYGFIIYNLIFATIMIRAYMSWSSDAKAAIKV